MLILNNVNVHCWQQLHITLTSNALKSLHTSSQRVQRLQTCHSNHCIFKKNFPLQNNNRLFSASWSLLSDSGRLEGRKEVGQERTAREVTVCLQIPFLVVDKDLVEVQGVPIQDGVLHIRHQVLVDYHQVLDREKRYRLCREAASQCDI